MPWQSGDLNPNYNIQMWNKSTLEMLVGHLLFTAVLLWPLLGKKLFFYSTELHLREYHHLTWYRIVKEWTHEETRLFPSVLLSLRSSFHLVSISSERTFDMGIP